MKRWSKFLFVALLAFAVSGCANTVRLSRGTIDSQRAAVLVSRDFLRNILGQNPVLASEMVFWDTYKSNKGSGFSRLTFKRQVEALGAAYSLDAPNQHPLLGLDLINVDVFDDNASVIFQKFQRSDAPEIEINLRWVGTGWLVEDDSLFGRGGLIAETGARNSNS